MNSDRLASAIGEILAACRVPGAALSILRDGRPLYRDCVGLMSLAADRKVDERSTFDIGSITKTFNSAAVALLVEERRLGWDSRAVDLLPGFQLADPWVTAEVNMRDLLGHRIGHGEDNITNYSSNFSRADILRQLRHLPLRVPFRSECAYQGYGPTAAGAIVEAISGLSWEDFIDRRIAAPLGLRDTHATYFRMPDRSQATDPHADLGDGVVVPIPHREFGNLAPSGSMTSSLRDLEAWMTLFAGDGAVGGTRLLQPATVAELLRPAILVRPAGIHPQRWRSRFEANFVGYGLGWYSHDFRGHRVIEHTGALEGFYCLGAAIPALGVAIVILTNLHEGLAPLALRYCLLAAALDLPAEDWLAKAKAATAPGASEVVMLDGAPYFWRPLGRQAGTRPAMALDAYAGRYRHDGFGAITVAPAGDRLMLDLFGNPLDLDHWHRELFRGVPRDRAIRLNYPEIFLRFEEDEAGRLTRLNLPTVGCFSRED